MLTEDQQDGLLLSIKGGFYKPGRNYFHAASHLMEEERETMRVLNLEKRDFLVQHGVPCSEIRDESSGDIALFLFTVEEAAA